MLLLLSVLLLAECYPIKRMGSKIEVLDDGVLNCIVIDKQNICIERDLIELKQKGAKGYQTICINGERVASGYPELQGRTIKVGKWYKMSGLSVDTDNLYFQYHKRLIRYNFKAKNFKEITFPNEIVKLQKISSTQTAIEYLEGGFIRLAIFDRNAYILKSVESFGAHTILRRGNIVDFIKCNDSKFVQNYLENLKKSGNKNLKSNFEEYLTPYQLPNRAHLYSVVESKGKRESFYLIKESPKGSKRDGELSVTSVLLNSHMHPLSVKHFATTQKEYFKLLQEDFKHLKKGLVWGYKSYFIALFTLFSIVVVIFWVRRLVGTLSLPTIASFFLFWYILIPVIGSTYMNIFYTEYEYNLGFYERKDLIFNIWLYTIIGLYLIPLGMRVANWFFRYDAKSSFKAFLEQPISYMYERALFYVVLVSMLISVGVLYLYIQKIGVVPILGVFQNLIPMELAELRSQASNGFAGKLYRYLFFIETLPLLWLIVAYFYKFVSRKWLITFIILLGYNIFVAIMDLEKAPLVNLLMVLLIVHFFIVGRINWKYLIAFIIVSIGALFVMYIYIMGVSTEGILATLAAPFHRAFIGTMSPFFWWQLYSEQFGLLHGLSLPNPHHIFDFENIEISKRVMDFVHPELQELGIVGSMPTTFWADWYINFGLFTTFLGMILFGFIMQSLDIFLINRMKKRKRVLMLALFVYLLFYFKRYIATSYLGMPFDTNLVLSVLMLLILNAILKRNFSIDEKSDLNRIK